MFALQHIFLGNTVEPRTLNVFYSTTFQSFIDNYQDGLPQWTHFRSFDFEKDNLKQPQRKNLYLQLCKKENFNKFWPIFPSTELLKEN